MYYPQNPTYDPNAYNQQASQQQQQQYNNQGYYNNTAHRGSVYDNSQYYGDHQNPSYPNINSPPNPHDQYYQNASQQNQPVYNPGANHDPNAAQYGSNQYGSNQYDTYNHQNNPYNPQNPHYDQNNPYNHQNSQYDQSNQYAQNSQYTQNNQYNSQPQNSYNQQPNNYDQQKQYNQYSPATSSQQPQPPGNSNSGYYDLPATTQPHDQSTYQSLHNSYGDPNQQPAAPYGNHGDYYQSNTSNQQHQDPNQYNQYHADPNQYAQQQQPQQQYTQDNQYQQNDSHNQYYQNPTNQYQDTTSQHYQPPYDPYNQQYGAYPNDQRRGSDVFQNMFANPAYNQQQQSGQAQGLPPPPPPPPAQNLYPVLDSPSLAVAKLDQSVDSETIKRERAVLEQERANFLAQQEVLRKHQEELRLQEESRLSKQNAEEERLRQELQQQREEVNKMKEQLQQKQSKAAEQEQEVRIAAYQKEEMNRQMEELRLEREMMKKREDEARAAMVKEQALQQEQLRQQQADLVLTQKQILEQARNAELEKEQQYARMLAEQQRKDQEVQAQKAAMALQQSQIEKRLQEVKLNEQQKMNEKKMQEEAMQKQQQELLRKQQEAENIHKANQEWLEAEKKRSKEALEKQQQDLVQKQQEIKRQQEVLVMQQKEAQALQRKDVIAAQAAAATASNSPKMNEDLLKPMRQLLVGTPPALRPVGKTPPSRPARPAPTKLASPTIHMSAIPTSIPIPGAPESSPPKPTPASIPMPGVPAVPSPPSGFSVPIPGTEPAPAVKSSPAAVRVAVALKRTLTRAQMRKAEDIDSSIVVDGVSLKQVIAAQRIARSWLNRRSLRRIVAAWQKSGGTEVERLRHRNVALMEILTSELSYCTNLQILCNSYQIPMTVEAVSNRSFSEHDVNIIFTSASTLLNVSKQLSSELEKRLKQWPSVQLFGDIFVRLAPVMKLYAEYINGFQRANERLTEVLATPEGAKFFAYCRKQSRSNLDIMSLLIMPVQRLPRYELLIKEVLKYSDESHIDHANMTKAYTEIQKINSYINSKKKDTDSRQKIMEVQKVIKSCPELVAAHRYYVREGQLQISTSRKSESGSFYVYLFNDWMIVTKKQGIFHSKDYEYVYTIKLANSIVKDVADPTMFRVLLGSMEDIDVKIYTFSAKDSKEKIAWLKDFGSIQLDTTNSPNKTGLVVRSASIVSIPTK